MVTFNGLNDVWSSVGWLFGWLVGAVKRTSHLSFQGKIKEELLWARMVFFCEYIDIDGIDKHHKQLSYSWLDFF